jgi:hypothetical protein
MVLRLAEFKSILEMQAQVCANFAAELNLPKRDSEPG